MGINAITMGIWAAAGIGSGGPTSYNSYADPYWSNVVLLLHCETLTDSSSTPLTITNSGAVVSTANAKFGSASLYLNTAGFYSYSAGGVISLPSVPFTFEGWFNTSSTTITETVFQIFNSISNYYTINIVNGAITLQSSSGTISTTGVVSSGSWYHIAWVCSSGTTYLFLNGTMIYSGTALIYVSGGYSPFIGMPNYGTGGYFKGYVDEIRFTKGIARYTSNFTPPDRAFPDPYADIQSPYDPYFNNVYALLHMDGANAGTVFTDSSKNNLTLTPTAVTTNTSKAAFGRSSAVFGGSGSGAQVLTPTSSVIDMSAHTTYTVEMWVNVTSYSLSPIVFSIYNAATYACYLTILSNGTVRWTVQNGASTYNCTSTVTMPTGRWAHLAVSVAANVVTIWLDGVQIATGTSTVTPLSGTYQVQVGNLTSTTGQEFPGYIDDFRFTLDVARYSAAFNPPTAAHWSPIMENPYWCSSDDVMTVINHAALTYHGTTGTATRSAMGASLSGADKWVGGVLGPDGKIYCVPAFASDILIIDPVAGTATRSAMGASLSGANNWLGGVLGPDGKIYCVPLDASDILIIDPIAGTATRSAMGASLGGVTKWMSGLLGPDGKIYCVPFAAADILIIDPAAGTATRSAMGASLSDTNKWYGGVLGPDGKIYCVPANATDILIIDPAAGTATRSAMGASLSGTTKWLGGVLGPDGKIYCVPRDSTDILIIDPIAGTATRSAMGASLSDTDKWYGGVLGPDGKIYCVPRDSADILIIDNPSVPDLGAFVCRSPMLNKF